MKIDRRFRLARRYSNKILRKYTRLFSGEIANISAWKDEDKQGNHYRDYFNKASKYYITNWGGTMGESGLEDEILLDLSKKLPNDLYKRFDVCFNHTTLEHVYNIQQAFTNICDMAREAVILVVPWSQTVHTSDSYADYWRISPYTLELMLEENGFSMVVCEYNKDFNAAIYIIVIGIRNEVMHKYKQFHKINAKALIPLAGERIGETLKEYIKQMAIWKRNSKR